MRTSSCDFVAFSAYMAEICSSCVLHPCLNNFTPTFISNRFVFLIRLSHATSHWFVIFRSEFRSRRYYCSTHMFATLLMQIEKQYEQHDKKLWIFLNAIFTFVTYDDLWSQSLRSFDFVHNHDFRHAPLSFVSCLLRSRDHLQSWYCTHISTQEITSWLASQDMNAPFHNAE